MPDPVGPRRPQRVLVVVPAYQEQSCVAVVVEQIRAAVPTLQVVVVDDGSQDGTTEAAARAGALVITLPFNLGVGAAMRAGFLYAVRHGYDAVIQVDGDGQHDPAGITLLVDALAHADVVVGSRFAGSDQTESARWRRLVMRVLAWIVSRLCRTRLTDVTSGFRAAGPRALGLLSRHYPAEYLGDTIESLVIAHRAGMVIAEIPVAMRRRLGGVPSQTLMSASMYFGRSLLVLLLAVVRSHPEIRSKSVGGR
jgi:glycosyltransferase involved in cell wall biosynthesis